MKINHYLKSIFTVLSVIIILVLPYLVFAQNPLGNLKDVGENSGYQQGADETTMARQIGGYVKVFLSLLGIIFVILLIYGGYSWMMARGDDGAVNKAKDTIWRAVIGLIITVSAYAIYAFVFIRIIEGKN